jgi:hypothetical protein
LSHPKGKTRKNSNDTQHALMHVTLPMSNPRAALIYARVSCGLVGQSDVKV